MFLMHLNPKKVPIIHGMLELCGWKSVDPTKTSRLCEAPIHQILMILIHYPARDICICSTSQIIQLKNKKHIPLLESLCSKMLKNHLDQFPVICPHALKPNIWKIAERIPGGTMGGAQPSARSPRDGLEAAEGRTGTGRESGRSLVEEF